MEQGISTIIIDNEPVYCKSLSQDLSSFPQIKVIKTFTSTEKAKKTIFKHQPYLLFLDIKMQEQNGFEFLREIRSKIHSDICVIFHTAYDYKLEAIRNTVFDYLPKPYTRKELTEIVERVSQKNQEKSQPIKRTKQTSIYANELIAIPMITKIKIWKCTDILYFKCQNRHWYIFSQDKEKSENKLPRKIKAAQILEKSTSFFKINSHCIININYLDYIENSTYKCKLKDDSIDFNEAVSPQYYAIIKKELGFD